MEYEQHQGRRPVDVSERNLGYDVVSEGDGEIRYIEVKARAEEGQIILTPNEWMTARQLGEKAWLYVVANAAREPRLYLIQNPAAKLRAVREVRIVRYVVERDEWKQASLQSSP